MYFTGNSLIFIDVIPIIAGIFTSTFLRRYPARNVCIFGGLMYVIAQVLGSLSPSIYLLYFTHGVLIGNCDTHTYDTQIHQYIIVINGEKVKPKFGQ